MHEVFLCRLAAHPTFSKDSNFKIFLEYENDVSSFAIWFTLFVVFSCLSVDATRRSWWRAFSVVSLNLPTRFCYLVRFVFSVVDISSCCCLEGRWPFLWAREELLGRVSYSCERRNNEGREGLPLATKWVNYFKLVNDFLRFLDVADTYARIASHLEKCGNLEAANGDSSFGRFLSKMTDVLERLKKLEARVGTDEELKEADTLNYFARESQAGKVAIYGNNLK